MGAYWIPGRSHWAIGRNVFGIKKRMVSRTHLAHVRLERAFILVLVYNPRRIKRDRVLGVLDERCGVAYPKSLVQCSGLATKVGHTPGDLAEKLVAPT